MRINGLNPDEPQRGLLLHSEPSEVLGVLRACAGIQWAAASCPREVAGALREHRPTVVFSTKHSGFPGEAHRPAIEAPSVRWFHVGGSGTDHVDGYDERRVTLTHCAGVLAPFLGERAMAALLYLTTGLAETVRANARAEWSPTRFRSLRDRTVLILGAGAVGREFALRLRPFGPRIVGIRASGRPDPLPDSPFDEIHGPGALDEWLPRADVLSLNVRLDASTRRLIDGRRLALLPSGAVILNSSRGAVLDEAALPAALDAQLSGAWLDVFEIEPLPVASPLWAHPRVLVTPHAADQVIDYPVHFARRFVELWEAHLAGRFHVLDSA